jgi:hypothetical protein
VVVLVVAVKDETVLEVWLLKQLKLVNQEHTVLEILAVMVVNQVGVMILILALVVAVQVDLEQISLIFKLAVMVVREDITETFLEPALAKTDGLLAAVEEAHGALPLVVAVTVVLVAVVQETLQQETEAVLVLVEQVLILQEFLV